MRPNNVDVKKIKSDIIAGKYPSLAKLFGQSKSNVVSVVDNESKKAAEAKYNQSVISFRSLEIK